MKFFTTSLLLTLLPILVSASPLLEIERRENNEEDDICPPNFAHLFCQKLQDIYLPPINIKGRADGCSRWQERRLLQAEYPDRTFIGTCCRGNDNTNVPSDPGYIKSIKVAGGTKTIKVYSVINNCRLDDPVDKPRLRNPGPGGN